MAKKLNRRNFLRGAGVAIALPTMTSLLPRGAFADASGPCRLVTLYHPNGTPQARGDSTPPSGLIERLAEFADQLSIVTNINNTGLKNQQYGVLSHAHMNCFLPLYSSDVIPEIGQENRTFDQHIAMSHIGEGTRYRSLSAIAYAKHEAHQGVPPHYFNTMSWKGPGQPVEPWQDPRAMFERVFAEADIADDTEAIAALNRRASFLDAVVGDIRDVRGRLSTEDRVRMDQYLTGIEELDQRTRELALGGPMAICDPTMPDSVALAESYPQRLEAFQDLAIKALECDLTRVFSLSHGGVAGGGAVINTTWVDGLEGVARGWHPLSHWDAPYANLSTDPNVNWRDFMRITQWQYDRVADFVRKLRDTPSASGASLLDETLVTWGSSMGYAVHFASEVYQVLIGGGSRFRKGLVLDADARNSGVLWNAVLEGFGVEGRVGRASETLDGLLV